MKQISKSFVLNLEHVLSSFFLFCLLKQFTIVMKPHSEITYFKTKETIIRFQLNNAHWIDLIVFCCKKNEIISNIEIVLIGTLLSNLEIKAAIINSLSIIICMNNVRWTMFVEHPLSAWISLMNIRLIIIWKFMSLMN